MCYTYQNIPIAYTQCMKSPTFRSVFIRLFELCLIGNCFIYLPDTESGARANDEKTQQRKYIHAICIR